MNDDCKVKINGKIYTAVIGENAADILAGNGFVVSSECGSNRKCGKCKIKITGKISPICETEKQFLTDYEIKSDIRLACCTKILGDAVIITKEDTDYIIPEYRPTVTETDGEDGIGMAVDLGTTTVSAAFFDLKDGKPICVRSSINNQRIHGADVISRIRFAALSDGNLSLLKNEAANTINKTIDSAGISPDKIKKTVIAGNTTMELISAGFPVDSLGEYPYEPISKLGITMSGKDTGLSCKNASVFFLPCAGGFFGGDAIGCMLAADFDKTDKPVLSVDLGTNGEIAFTEDGKTFFGTSSAAGPAFEGGEIFCGTGSISGAICKARILDGVINLTTVNKTKPTGICGSGLIDLIAAYRKCGLIDENGMIQNVKKEIDICGGIKLIQNDIREFQKAKSAVHASTEVLLKKLTSPVKKVFLYGGMGTAIDIDNAVYTGLFPADLKAVAAFAGNGSLQGASMILLSEKNKKRCDDICKHTQVIDLSLNNDFEKSYITHMKL